MLPCLACRQRNAPFARQQLQQRGAPCSHALCKHSDTWECKGKSVQVVGVVSSPPHQHLCRQQVPQNYVIPRQQQLRCARLTLVDPGWSDSSLIIQGWLALMGLLVQQQLQQSVAADVDLAAGWHHARAEEPQHCRQCAGLPPLPLQQCVVLVAVLLLLLHLLLRVRWLRCQASMVGDQAIQCSSIVAC